MNTKTLFWALFFLQIFILLAIAVFYYPQGVWLDREILLTLHGSASASLDQFATLFTDLAIYQGTVPIVLVINLILAYGKKWGHLAYVDLTALGAIALGYQTKSFFSRVRPHLWQSTYPWPDSFSFPSSHAFSSMTLVIILIILGWQTNWRNLIIILGSIFVIFIGWTRVYLGVHYPTDILGGWSLAIAWSLLVQGFISGFTKNRNTILKNE
ncbi:MULTISPECIES: phosphatase PAP2 family protein [unclassified Synechocystis]|uniref:phosphatase PAP2 family protein n=1 Tax=unclassified Synechocystis TaxID=2640012 RepID=UPI0003F51092|nr:MULTISPECIES: phosphatase PAP2 family protein [unclassified Synechocystis]AIE75665.1 Membrane-associated phospholipid phosphatase [Synechocystis sp. PCC 6714]MCT0253852.1 phosphatase PAP2 family protein [Synechocystis sp. CS-94]